MGLALLISAERVYPEVAPSAGTFSATGDERISSRVGTGRLGTYKSIDQ